MKECHGRNFAAFAPVSARYKKHLFVLNDTFLNKIHLGESKKSRQTRKYVV